MALPDQSHHVHSDGYYSDKGEPDMERMMMELADEIEDEPFVQAVYPDNGMDGPYVEVEYTPDYTSGEHFERIDDIADDFGCTVVTIRRGSENAEDLEDQGSSAISDDDGLLEVRPE